MVLRPYQNVVNLTSGFQGMAFTSNCEWTDGRTDGRIDGQTEPFHKYKTTGI